MGVLTSKDLNDKVVIEEKKKDTVKAVSPSLKKTEYKYILDTAPMGRSSMAFYYENLEMQINLVDKEYKLTEKDDKKIMRKMLLSLGFRDASIVEKVKPKVKPVKTNWIFGHPDNAPDEKITGNIALTIKDETIQLECKDGVIKTNEKAIADELFKMGFYEVIKQEKNNE